MIKKKKREEEIERLDGKNNERREGEDKEKIKSLKIKE